MPTTLTAFVTSCFAGRAGLFRATLLPVTGGAPVTVQVSDLDADPERFNERLTKVHLFRDAMDRAEPVVVVHVARDEGGNEVESVARLTRDHLGVGQSLGSVTGVVLTVELQQVQAVAGSSERTDIATVRLLDFSDPAGIRMRTLALALQAPERGTAGALLSLLREAELSGDPLHLRTFQDSGKAEVQQWIYGARRGELSTAEEVADGFVESIGARMIGTSLFTEVLITTAPALAGVGRVADPSYFVPERLFGMVAQRSPQRQLLEAALRDGLRVRVGFFRPGQGRPTPPGTERPVAGVEVASSVADSAVFKLAAKGQASGSDPSAEGLTPVLLLGTVALAPLASAARPVWVRIRRESLDGPPVGECAPGTPSSDLSPAGVASLQVPHRAAWEGEGCFNHGIYRIQVVSPVPVKILIDGREVQCVQALPHEPPQEGLPPQHHREEESEGAARHTPEVLVRSARAEARARLTYQTYLAHACLHDLHTVRVEVGQWRCGYQFLLDVIKLR